jgi:hypothetical protein
VSIWIPRTSDSRGEFTYARVLWRVHPDRTMANAFEGVLLKPGSVVEDSALWPDARYPARPLLLEFAGSDRTGRGHNRSNQIYILWRFEPDQWQWVEIARVFTQGAEWVPMLLPLALRELGGVMPAPDPAAALDSMKRFLAQLDDELRQVGSQERAIAIGFMYEQLGARLANC